MNLAPEFRMINEDDHVYDTFSSFDEALDMLHQYPNDHIEVHLVKRKGYSLYHAYGEGNTHAEVVASALADAAAFYELPADQLEIVGSYTVHPNYKPNPKFKSHAYPNVGIKTKEDKWDGTQ